MTVRSPVVCISCDSKIITRAQVGHKDMQKHSFPCPTCGVVITYILDLDQEKVSYKFRDPENGKWADDEEGAIKTLTFSDEIVVPASMPDFSRGKIKRDREATHIYFRNHICAPPLAGLLAVALAMSSTTLCPSSAVERTPAGMKMATLVVPDHSGGRSCL